MKKSKQSSMCSVVWIVALMMGATMLIHCGPPEQQQTQNELTSCVEDDVKAIPFFGPLVGDKGQLTDAPEGDFFVVTTHLKLRTDSQESMGIFQQVMGGLQAAFPKASGLLAASLYLSEKCGYARTLTIWKDYESVMKFVVSEAHANAMVNAPKITSHFRTTHWQGDAKVWPVTWDRAKERLLDISIKTYK